MGNLEKEKLHRIDFLYIASMVLFFLGWGALRSPILNMNYNQDSLYMDLWFMAISSYSFGALLCYFIGIFKIKRYNNSNLVIEDYKYKINHYYGLFNFLLIFFLDFGLLFMMLTYDLCPAHYSSILLYLALAIIFLLFFILRSTKLKKVDQMGLRSFDFNAFLYYLYAAFMLTLNVFGIKMDMLWMGLVILINFTITNFSVYYPVKAMVYAKDKEEYNPVKTVYKFVRRMIDKKIFFFIGLAFTILLGAFYWLGGVYSVNDQFFNIYFIIALFYFGLAALRFFNSFWKKKIDLSGDNKLKSLSKVAIYNSITTLVLTILLGGLLIYIFNDSLKKESQSWFIFVQAGFVGFRMVFLIMDIIKANKCQNPYDISIAEGSALSTSVMVFSIILSMNLYFGFNEYHKWLSIILVFIILTSGLYITIHEFTIGILGLKGKLKVKEEEI